MIQQFEQNTICTLHSSRTQKHAKTTPGICYNTRAQLDLYCFRVDTDTIANNLYTLKNERISGLVYT